MALNANEINYLISELDFNDTFIQDIVEHDFHSFTMCLFSKQEKALIDTYRSLNAKGKGRISEYAGMLKNSDAFGESVPEEDNSPEL